MRLAVLGRDGSATRILVHAVQAEHEVATVVLEQPEPRLDFLRRRARRLGMGRVLGEVAFRALAVPLLERRSAARRRALLAEYALDERPLPAALVRTVRSANDEAAVAALRDAAPDVVVLAGPRIVAAHVLESVGTPFVNVHAGWTPRYRGVHGGYWALARGDRAHCGVTVHLVDTGVDTGGALARGRIDPGPDDSFTTYPLLQLAAGIPLLLEVLPAVAAGTAATLDTSGEPSRLWTHPTLAEYLRGRRRGVR